MRLTIIGQLTAAADDEQLEPVDGAFEAVLVVEEIRTSDGREIAAGALDWRELPIPLMLLTEDIGPGHTGSRLAGKITDITYVAPEYRARGVWDLGSADGREGARLVADQVLRWVSIDLEIEDAEVVLEGDCDEEGGDCREILRVEKGRIMGATAVAFPAFPQAVIVPAGTTIPPATENGRPEAEAEAEMGVSDEPWDPSPSRFTDDQWAAAAAACNAGGCVLAHHEPDGTLSRRALTLATDALAEAPEALREEARRHLAHHYRRDLAVDVPDALQAPPRPAPIISSAAPVLPPREWFDDPQLTEPTPLTITDEGRVFGYVATQGTCHVGFPDVCVTAPSSAADYAYFMTGLRKTACDCDEDSHDLVRVGQITMDAGHAPRDASAKAAAAHYDNTAAAVADVVVGEDSYGIWMAGALRPEATPEQIARLKAAGSVSGDWRAISGNLELVGVLAVNVPGFPIPRPAARVASGEQISLVAAGVVRPRDPVADRFSMLEARCEALEAANELLLKRLAPQIRASILASVDHE